MRRTTSLVLLSAVLASALLVGCNKEQETKFEGSAKQAAMKVRPGASGGAAPAGGRPGGPTGGAAAGATQ